MLSRRESIAQVQQFQYAVRTDYPNGKHGYLLESSPESAQRYIDEQLRIHNLGWHPMVIVMREVGPWVQTDVLGTQVEELGLLQRTVNFLLRVYPEPVTTLGDLVGAGRRELEWTRGFGPATLKDIDNMLERYGLPYYSSPWRESQDTSS